MIPNISYLFLCEEGYIIEDRHYNSDEEAIDYAKSLVSSGNYQIVRIKCREVMPHTRQVGIVKVPNPDPVFFPAGLYKE